MVCYIAVDALLWVVDIALELQQCLCIDVWAHVVAESKKTMDLCSGLHCWRCRLPSCPSGYDPGTRGMCGARETRCLSCAMNGFTVIVNAGLDADKFKRS